MKELSVHMAAQGTRFTSSPNKASTKHATNIKYIRYELANSSIEWMLHIYVDQNVCVYFILNVFKNIYKFRKFYVIRSICYARNTLYSLKFLTRLLFCWRYFDRKSSEKQLPRLRLKRLQKVCRSLGTWRYW